MGTEYSRLVESLAKPGKEIYQEISYGDCHVLHMLLGLSGEVGELIDGIKKNIIYGKELDMANVVEELGDIEFYLEGLRQAFGVSRSLVLEQNTAKLTKRYGERYSNQAAIDRLDKSA